MRRKGILIGIVFFFIVVSSLSAEIYSIDGTDTVIGFPREHRVEDEESLIEIARKFDLGYNEIIHANPGVDPFVPEIDAPIQIPTMRILPQVTSYTGIVINLSEMRLYYFIRQNRSAAVMTFPIGIGREGYDTPTGKFRIIEKIVDPPWLVPESIRAENPTLPKVVPPGPNNPLGSHALRLSLGNVLIHGTNKPWGVGRRVSHGCIRLYPEDIPRLFSAVGKGETVTIVRQPVKVGLVGDTVFIEVHQEDAKSERGYFDEAMRLLKKKHLLSKVNTDIVLQALREKRGAPVEISH